MTVEQAREFLQSIGYVPGVSATRDSPFDPKLKPRAERPAAEALVVKIKQACRVLFDAECEAARAARV